MAQPFASDIPAVDRYLTEGYDGVRGMSSKFSATITAWLMHWQTTHGVSGHVCEIGTFEGRFFIALALALTDGERALGIDTFEWPSPAVLDNFHRNCAGAGVPLSRVIAHKGRSDALSPADITGLLGGGPVRVFHVDGDHSRTALTADLDLARAALHPQGLIVIDDMLHPEYPLLVVAVHDWLTANPDMKVLAILDREDIVAAAKFVLCHADAVPLYEKPLMERFAAQHYVMGSEWERFWSVVLTPHPRLAVVD